MTLADIDKANVSDAPERFVDRIYGGINMTWPKVIIISVASAVLTAIFLILPIFDRTSFREMGATFEAWIFIAVFIMVNCKKPLESAVKTFVFFVISQPLIYLLQVPFSYMGWALFGYYRNWVLWTLLTFPMAFVGWYLKKGNWLSLLILTPVDIFLALIAWGHIRNHLLPNFPNYLISVLFCLGQIALYIYVFFRGWKLRAIGAGIVIAVLILYMSFSNIINVGVGMPLPDEPTLSDSAVVSINDDSYGEAELTVTDGEGYLNLRMYKYGELIVTVTDKDKIYRYRASTHNDNGTTTIDIVPYEE